MDNPISRTNTWCVGVSVAVYGAACALWGGACVGDRAARGYALSNDASILFLLLGPAANLGWGTKLVWPFLVGTLVFFSLVFLLIRVKRRELRLFVATIALLAWFVSAIPAVAAII